MPQSIISNTGIAFAGRILNVGLGLAATALMTRFLGPASFGSYVLLLSFGTVVQLFADAGLYLTLTREIARRPEEEKTILSHILSLRVALLVLVFGVAVAATYFVPIFTNLNQAFVFIALGLSFQSLSQIFMGVFQRYSEMWRPAAADTVGRVIQVILIIVVGQAFASTRAMAAIFMVSAAVVWLVHLWLLPRVVAWGPSFNRQAWTQILKVSWPLGLMLLVNAIYFRADVVILSFFRPAAEVGWYGIAYRVIDSGLFFPAMFGGLLLPRFSEALAKNNWQAMRQLIEAGLVFLFGAGAFALLILSVKSAAVINIIGGAAFAPAAPLLAWLSVALVAMFFGNLFGFALVAMERQKDLLKLYLLLVVFNIALNLIFIPRRGALAAAVITLLTEIVSLGTAAFWVRAKIPFGLNLGAVLKVLVATAMAGASLYLSSAWPFVWQVALAGGVYVAACAVLGLYKQRYLGSLLVVYSAA